MPFFAHGIEYSNMDLLRMAYGSGSQTKEHPVTPADWSNYRKITCKNLSEIKKRYALLVAKQQSVGDEKLKKYGILYIVQIKF